MKAHGLVLPDGLRERVERSGGVPPAVAREQVVALERPAWWPPDHCAFILGLKQPAPADGAPG